MDELAEFPTTFMDDRSLSFSNTFNFCYLLEHDVGIGSLSLYTLAKKLRTVNFGQVLGHTTVFLNISYFPLFTAAYLLWCPTLNTVVHT